MAVRAFITGLSGTTLTAAERAFLREREPWGFIIFARNVETPSQLSRLLASVRDAVRRDAPVLVDQEGGRVQRLGPPHWPSYGESAEKVAVLARAVTDGLLAGGVLPVLKHIPGHGRATADSHRALPVVEADQATLRSTDFAAFRPLSDLPLGMTAHVVYTAIDPIAPATTSVTLVRDVIRGWLKFAGVLMSDDISMNALSGSLEERSRAAIAAGCDLVLHCSGELEEMQAVASAAPLLTGEAAKRADAALIRRGHVRKDDLAVLRAEWAALMHADAGAGRRATS